MASAVERDHAPFAVGASVRAAILASPEQLWAWIADPTRHPQLAGSGEPQAVRVIGSQPHGIGTHFESDQKIVGLVRYVTRSEVVGFEPYRRFHFRVGDQADWDFLLEPADGPTLVTHRHRFNPPRRG